MVTIRAHSASTRSLLRNGHPLAHANSATTMRSSIPRSRFAPLKLIRIAVRLGAGSRTSRNGRGQEGGHHRCRPRSLARAQSWPRQAPTVASRDFLQFDDPPKGPKECKLTPDNANISHASSPRTRRSCHLSSARRMRKPRRSENCPAPDRAGVPIACHDSPGPTAITPTAGPNQATQTLPARPCELRNSNRRSGIGEAHHRATRVKGADQRHVFGWGTGRTARGEADHLGGCRDGAAGTETEDGNDGE